MVRRRSWLLLLIVMVAVVTALSLYSQYQQSPSSGEVTMPEARSHLIVFGNGDKAPAVWDGRVTLSSGQILSIQGWRFSGQDTTDQRSNWKVSTRYGPATGNQTQGPLLENGLLVTATFADPAARFSVETLQGSFSFTAEEITYGSLKPFLNKRVLVEQVPVTQQLTTSEEEQDFPAVAQSGDDVWVSYVQFVHGDRSQAQGAFSKDPGSLDFLARPVGGDQVFLMNYSKSKRVWSEPIPVTATKQDVMRTAIAVDRQQRVWVFWSANQDGNLDLYARFYAQGKWSARLRLTYDPGPDLNPVATTDIWGRVWVAWQGYRNNNLEILLAAQTGDSFTSEATVSVSPASDWDPAIAAAPRGEIAVSWDTYDKGDYDVYFRRARFDEGVGIVMDTPTPVAASQYFEARSAIAYDPQNRLWVAYEASEVKWGKDFGAYEKSGVALYQGHNLQVKCFPQAANGFATTHAMGSVLPGPPTAQLFARRIGVSQGALNSFPRLAVDGDGKVYLGFRAASGNGRSPVGSIWLENLVYFNGTKWNGPVIFPNTDNILDARPALLVTSPGVLLMVSAADHRQSQTPGGGKRAGDWINNDLYAAELRLPRSQQPIQLTALPTETVAPPQDDVAGELDQVASMRNYRTSVGGKDFQLLRGEFHRHTEISGDGGRDGPLIDAYRYLIDAAYMDWGGCCDHDNGGGREYNWWIQQKLTDAYKLEGRYIPMFSYERSVGYPEGHRNPVFAQRGIRTLPRLPKMPVDSPPSPAPDTQMLYRYLKQFGGIVASHTSATDMGTDWRDNDPLLEPVVEIYQGDRQNYEMPGAPRTATGEQDSIGGWRPLGFVSLALQKGYRLGFQASSDHISTHMSYCNLWVTAPTREGIMEALYKRRVYGATDNILADVRCGEHFMGEEFTLDEPPSIWVRLLGRTDFAKVYIIKNNQYVYTAEPNARWVDFVWRDLAAEKGRTGYYYVRGEQTDGELVWVSPMWIAYK